MDFVWKARGRPPVAIECKWRAEQAGGRAFATFRSLYPDASCWVIAADRETLIRRHRKEGEVVELGLANLPGLIASHRAGE